MMKMVMISEQDAAQVKAILLTHAEMQDQRSVEAMSVMSRLRIDEPETAADTIDDIAEHINTFDSDVDNLRRIAKIF